MRHWGPFRIAVFVRWLIFGVSLPLLPIGSRAMAQWIDGSSVDFTLSGLFGDGELLVIATVVSAAGIGDLVFDLRRTSRRSTLSGAVVASFALICVIFSVLLYGLVTLRKEAQTPAQKTAIARVQTSKNDLESAEQAQLTEARQLGVVQRLYRDEISRDPRGVDPFARALQAQIIRGVQDVQAAQVRVARSNILLSAAQAQSIETADKVSNNTIQAAIASLIMFVASLGAGSLCILSQTRSDTAPLYEVVADQTTPALLPDTKARNSLDSINSSEHLSTTEVGATSGTG